MSNIQIIPVVLCGGSGTRLWPISRDKMPKQFLNLMGNTSLLQETVLRSVSISGASSEELVVVTLGDMKEQVAQQLSELGDGYTKHILSEPMARNTSGCIAYAAMYVMKTFGPDALMWVLPSDHHIADEQNLSAALNAAVPAALGGHLMTFGIHPTRPETGYGYIQTGDDLDGFSGVRKVGSFVEKPPKDIAASYLAAGNYLWNSGMFLLKTDVLLLNFRQLATSTYDIVLKSIQNNIASPSVEYYATLPDEPFDKVIMEKSNSVAVVPCDPAWSDIGGWESLWEISHKDDNGNVVDGKVALHNSKDCIVRADNRLVACVGVENLVIADTGDAILIANKNNSDDIKTLVKRLKAAGRKETFEPTAAYFNWGSRKTISDTPNFQIREITLKSGHILFAQPDDTHNRVWTVVAGEAILITSGGRKLFRKHNSFTLKQSTQAKLENPSDLPMTLIEITTLVSAEKESQPVFQEEVFSKYAT